MRLLAALAFTALILVLTADAPVLIWAAFVCGSACLPVAGVVLWREVRE